MDSNGITLGNNFASGAFSLTGDANTDNEPVLNGPPSAAAAAAANIPNAANSSSCSGLDARVRVDVPLRVFTESYYPHLTALYDRVGVKYQVRLIALKISSCDL